MATIGICMIVKNEAHVIRRCLESARPLIDYVLVVDTGSTDGTQEVILRYLAEVGLAGEVVDEPWRNFADNRSSALKHMRERKVVDYALMLDADSYLVYEKGFDARKFKQSLTADLYDVTLTLGTITYLRNLITSNRVEFSYKGALHEYLDPPPGITREVARGFVNFHAQDSARNQNPRKYQDDAETLEKILVDEQDPFLRTRYTFYMAQSYRDAGEDERALEAYLQRSTMGGWAEEVFISLLTAGNLHAKLNHEDSKVIQAYLDAYEFCPTRSESLHAAAAYCRYRNKFHQAYLLAKHGLTIAAPPSSLFSEGWIYDYGLLDELAIAAYWAGHYKESFDSCVKLLKNPRLSEDYRERILQNARFSIEKLNRPSLANLLPKV